MGTGTGSGLAEQSTTARRGCSDGGGGRGPAHRRRLHLSSCGPLLSEIWAGDDQPIVPAEIIRTLAHVNAYGAFAPRRRRGRGCRPRLPRQRRARRLPAQLRRRRQATRRGSSVGFALKQHQRAWALQRGLSRITWTFDPLVRRNAYFNLVKLGATAVAFHRDFYGSMRRRGECRRLERPHPRRVGARLPTRRRREHRPFPARRAGQRRRGPWCACPWEPVVRPWWHPSGAPSNWSRSPTTSSRSGRRPGLARRWRIAAPRHARRGLDEGGHVDAFTRDGWYVVRRPARVIVGLGPRSRADACGAQLRWRHGRTRRHRQRRTLGSILANLGQEILSVVSAPRWARRRGRHPDPVRRARCRQRAARATSCSASASPPGPVRRVGFDRGSRHLRRRCRRPQAR